MLRSPLRRAQGRVFVTAVTDEPAGAAGVWSDMSTKTKHGNKPEGDRIVQAIDITVEMLGKLRNGLMAGEPLEELEKLARDLSISATAIETLVRLRYDQGRNKLV